MDLNLKAARIRLNIIPYPRVRHLVNAETQRQTVVANDWVVGLIGFIPNYKNGQIMHLFSLYVYLEVERAGLVEATITIVSITIFFIITIPIIIIITITIITMDTTVITIISMLPPWPPFSVNNY